MAGIGFELRRMIDQRDGFVAKVRAYACAGLISSGPWVMTILTLTLLNLAGPYLSGESDYSMFRALVTYAFAFSLILQGFGQMAITRRVADLLYAKQYERVLPAFVASLLATGIAHALLGGLFSWWAGFNPALAVVFVMLLTLIGMTWISLIWLSVAREYDEVLRAYIYGTLVSLVGMVVFNVREGPLGILGAYTAGQAFILVLLVRTILRGMEKGGERDFSVFTAIKAFPMLVGVGFFYNAGIWADKMIFWFNDGTGPHPFVQYHPLYDTCSFLAYLTVVPALAVNLIRLETSFYEHYRAYYGAILGGTPLSVIEEKKARMFENLQESTIRLIRVQGALTVFVILFASYIINALEMPPVAVRIFRLTCLGAFFHVLLLITVLMQLYFDLRPQALATSFVFLLLNAGMAWWSVSHGIATYGVGYATAAFLSLILGYTLLHRSLERIDYLTFTSQPIDADPPGATTEVEAVAETEEDDKELDEEAPVEPHEEVPVPAPEPAEVGEPEPPQVVIVAEEESEDLADTRTGTPMHIPVEPLVESEEDELDVDTASEDLGEGFGPLPEWTPAPTSTWSAQLGEEDQTLTEGVDGTVFSAPTPDSDTDGTASAVGFPDPAESVGSDETATGMGFESESEIESDSSPEIEAIGLEPAADGADEEPAAEEPGGRIVVEPGKVVVFPAQEPGEDSEEPQLESTVAKDDETMAD